MDAATERVPSKCMILLGWRVIMQIVFFRYYFDHEFSWRLFVNSFWLSLSSLYSCRQSLTIFFISMYGNCVTFSFRNFRFFFLFDSRAAEYFFLEIVAQVLHFHSIFAWIIIGKREWVDNSILRTHIWINEWRGENERHYSLIFVRLFYSSALVFCFPLVALHQAVRIKNSFLSFISANSIFVLSERKWFSKLCVIGICSYFIEHIEHPIVVYE